MKSRLMIVLALSFVGAGCGSNTNQTIGRQTPVSEESTKLANQAHIDEGMQQLQNQNVPAAIKSFDEAIKQNPRDPRGYLVLGQTYLHLKEYNRAINTFAAATKVAPEEGEAFYLLAVSYGLTGNTDLARSNAEKSIKIFQNQKNQPKFLRSVALLKGLTEAQTQ